MRGGVLQAEPIRGVPEVLAAGQGACWTWPQRAAGAVRGAAAQSRQPRQGHRNIQGLAIDRQGGRIWASEHGAKGGDALNRIEAGENNGWPTVTHSRESFGPAIAPSGLAVYNGDRYPGWRGDLFAGARVRDVRQGPDGSLSALTDGAGDGQLLRLEPIEQTGPRPWGRKGQSSRMIPMARRGASSFLSDFKDFINKGNVVDLAVAVVIGSAFAKVVDAIVSLVMTNALEPALKAARVDSISAWPAGTVVVALINFLVIAFVVFLIVRAIEGMRRQEEAKALDAGPDPQAELAAAANRLAEALDRRAL